MFHNFWKKVALILLLILLGATPFYALPVSTVSAGVTGTGKLGYQLEAEQAFTKRFSYFAEFQNTRLLSHDTQEIALGLRYFRNPSRSGPFFSVGASSFAVTDDWSSIGYFIEFGGRLPLRSHLFLSVSTKIDYLQFEKLEEFRASLSTRLGYGF